MNRTWKLKFPIHPIIRLSNYRYGSNVLWELDGWFGSLVAIPNHARSSNEKASKLAHLSKHSHRLNNCKMASHFQREDHATKTPNYHPAVRPVRTGIGRHQSTSTDFSQISGTLRSPQDKKSPPTGELTWWYATIKEEAMMLLSNKHNMGHIRKQRLCLPRIKHCVWFSL